MYAPTEAPYQKLYQVQFGFSLSKEMQVKSRALKTKNGLKWLVGTWNKQEEEHADEHPEVKEFIIVCLVPELVKNEIQKVDNRPIF